MDTIFIHGIKVQTVIGVYEWERRFQQTVVLDIEFGADTARAAASDRIEDTLNYKNVCKRVVAFVESSQFQLVETLAERVAELVRGEFEVPWVRVRLNKPGALRGARDVGVIIERGERN
ncbi:MAG: dihydroneopterin aldolase [Gammaproteobacteria bacterium]|nr:dihydroneopterin aldolase [Gammaproteobacteria bacterium]NIR82748.1 dihydroneopterin aldolase [Gammaproteobacteria bacterium]NIR89612.1 dihydroneopterin aldolase [Gammaproteobacteria bacterium]NIU03908.1 dihydroneopterin aldolase [Gammaproteobacteria bacterium]NIV51224.1 dihydroneopterin aldolase [Gammaproteobacteria bacterium]